MWSRTSESESSYLHELDFVQGPGSSVSIVTDYRLDDRVTDVRSPAGAKDFSSSLCVLAGYGAHPASYPLCTGEVLSPGVKSGRGVTLTTRTHLVPRS
jgi:hypothetical protein